MKWPRYTSDIYTYITQFFLFVNHVKTTKRINKGLRPYDAKSSVDGHIPFPILFLINFHSYIFPPIKTEDNHITVTMETYVAFLF